MKTITKQYLENEIADMTESAEQLKAFASISPFGNAMDLEKTAEEYLKKAEDRVSVAIWQKHRITVLRSLLEELE